MTWKFFAANDFPTIFFSDKAIGDVIQKVYLHVDGIVVHSKSVSAQYYFPPLNK